MCGIGGVLGSVVDQTVLRDSCAAMRHRGPDDEATWLQGDIGLAHTRLAIIDRAGGAQPMCSAEERFVVVFNGEIYNHRAIRRELEQHGYRFRTNADTEVLLALYEREGAAMVERLRGMFAFAVVDRLERRALLARDRFGEKPLCFAQLPGGGVAFASTLDALRPLLPSTPEVDLQALAEYLVLQYVPAPRSVWEGVRKLPPGHLAEWGDGRFEVRAYWSPPEREAGVTDRSEASARFRELVRDSVTARLESEVPLGVFLSGGLDSSVVVAELTAAGAAPATYSVGFKREAFDETRYARMVAERFGTDHHELIADDDPEGSFEELTRAYDEPFADSSALATLAVAKVAREHVTVILTGDGGDELFGGYERYAAFRRAERIRRRLGPLAAPASLGARAAGRVTGSARLSGGSAWVRDPWGGYRDALFHFAPVELATILRPEVAAAVDRGGPVRRLDELWTGRPDTAETLSWIDQRTYLPEDLLVKMDRATMAHSLEARSPLLDQELAAFAAGLPGSMLFDGDTGKALLRHAYREVLPSEVLSRPKMGFGVPLASWLRSELRPAVGDLLLSDEGPLWTWLRPEPVRRLVQDLLVGDDRARWRVWNLLALAGWASARRR